MKIELFQCQHLRTFALLFIPTLGKITIDQNMRKRYIFGILFWLVFSGQASFGQSSKNEYRGDWINCNTWDVNSCSDKPGITDLKNTTINIKGFVTLKDNLSFTNNANLIIESGDTLVVIGDLVFKNNANLNINSNGVLVVTGSLISQNNISVAVNGSVVVLEDFEIQKNTDVNGSGQFYVVGRSKCASNQEWG